MHHAGGGPNCSIIPPFITTTRVGQRHRFTSNQMVLTAGIVSDLIRGDVFQWGKIMAGCVIAAAPPIVIYAFLMDDYTVGLTACVTKG